MCLIALTLTLNLAAETFLTADRPDVHLCQVILNYIIVKLYNIPPTNKGAMNRTMCFITLDIEV